MTGDEIRDKQQEIMKNAIQESINISEEYLEDQKGLVVKWVVVAEVAQGDGDISIWATAARGMKSWQTLGILHDVLIFEETKCARGWQGEVDE